MRTQQVRDNLEKVDIFQTVRLNEVYPSMLKEMADVIAGPTNICEKSCQLWGVPDG